jgi:protease-4
MKKKQIVGIVIAGLVFVFVCISGVLSNYLSNQLMKETNKDMVSFLMAAGESYELPLDPFIGVVKVEGTIADVETSVFETALYNHQGTLDYIDAMMDSDANRGILLYVNSPGGGVYESDELYLKLMEYKEATNRPIWTYMGNQACSGGYYISMASDQVVANRNCWTGSIGVIISLTNLKGLYDKLGIQEIDITSGKNKAMGSSGQDMTDEQRGILQSMVDEAYEQFVGIVATGRDLDIDTVKSAADGRIYTAKQALDLNLIDSIDSYENMISNFCDEVGDDVEMYEPYNTTTDLVSSLFSMYKGVKTKSDAQIVTEYLENKGNGVLMYYAEPGQY